MASKTKPTREQQAMRERLRRRVQAELDPVFDVPLPKERRARAVQIAQVAQDFLLRRLPADEMDEAFYDEMRACLLEAGATDREIDTVAASIVTLVVECTPNNRDFRFEQFELICDHLCCTPLRVSVIRRRSDRRGRRRAAFLELLCVEFPDPSVTQLKRS